MQTCCWRVCYMLTLQLHCVRSHAADSNQACRMTENPAQALPNCL
jgi:hypothetical protein